MTLVIHKPPQWELLYYIRKKNNDGPRHLELSSLEKALVLSLRINLGFRSGKLPTYPSGQ